MQPTAMKFSELLIHAIEQSEIPLRFEPGAEESVAHPVTEMLKICALAATYGVKVVPHGSRIAAPLHLIAAQPEWVCPMQEYILTIAPRIQFFFKDPFLAVDGYLDLPSKPGLGIEIDEDKVGRREVLERFG